MEKIPTVPFDPSRHVIACRENVEGRQEFVTLESLSEAERIYEQTAPAGDFVTKDQLAALQEIIIRAVGENLPPPQLSSEIAGALIEVSNAVATMKAEYAERIRRVEEAADTLTDALATIKRRLEGAET